MGSLPQLSTRGSLYDNSVYGDWLRPKGITKVSGILEVSDFNIKSRPFQILLGNFLATFRILSNFFCQRATSSNFSEN